MSRELKLTDRELQDLIAPPLRNKLREAGFAMGASMTLEGFSSAFYFPINLDLSGVCTVERDSDGVWTIRQCEDGVIADRIADASENLTEAIANRTRPLPRD